MSAGNNVKFLRQPKSSVAAIGLRLLALLACVSVLGISSALGQSAEYSDSYTIDNSGTQVATDPNTGEGMIATPDGAANPVVIGLGVSEAAYDSNVYSTQTYTTLSTPSGATSVSASSGGYTFAIAEAISIELTDNAEEGDYQVNSQHTYYYQQQDPCGPSDPRMEQPVQPCYMTQASPEPSRPLFQLASYEPSPERSLSFLRSAPPFWYYNTFTFFRFGVRRIYSGGVLRYGDDTCRGVYGMYFPFTYIKACPDGGSGCPLTYFICGQQPHYGVQAITYRIDYWFSYVCALRKWHYIGTAPYCRN